MTEPTAAPTYYDILTDTIIPTTQQKVDDWCLVADAYGKVRMALAKAVAEDDKEKASSTLLTELVNIHIELQKSLS